MKKINKKKSGVKPERINLIRYVVDITYPNNITGKVFHTEDEKCLNEHLENIYGKSVKYNIISPLKKTK